jgi:putative endonuclease
MMKQWLAKLLIRKPEAAHLKTGRWGEQQAVKCLKSKKYRIVGQRVFVGKHDEIDIVSEQGEILIFVEVKTRKNETYGRPFSAVNKEKRKRLSRAAVNYLKKKNIKPEYIRFDVIEVVGEPSIDSPVIRHIENAFQLDPSYKLWW